jgi:hypothetical protein
MRLRAFAAVAVCTLSVTTSAFAYDFNKDIVNLSGQAMTGAQVHINPAGTLTAQFSATTLPAYTNPFPSAPPLGVNSAQFQWTGGNVAQGQTIHVGWSFAHGTSPLPAIESVQWMQGNGVPTGGIALVINSHGKIQYSTNAGGNVVATLLVANTTGQQGTVPTQSMVLVGGSVRWATEASPVPLAQLNAGNTSIGWTTVPTTDQSIAPGGSVSIPLGTLPAGQQDTLVQYAIAGRGTDTNPESIDFVQDQPATSTPALGSVGGVTLIALLGLAGLVLAARARKTGTLAAG